MGGGSKKYTKQVEVAQKYALKIIFKKTDDIPTNAK